MRPRQAPPIQHLLLLPFTALLLLLPSASAFESHTSYYENLPSSIDLHAAVLHAPPFAVVSHDENGTAQFSGFQYDLLERLQVFAAQDDVDLTFHLREAPRQYEDALHLLAASSDSNNNSDNCTTDSDCLDMIVGNFYATPDRAMRVDLSPSWLKSTISTIKYKDKKDSKRDFTTLAQASDHNGTVCLKDGTFYAQVVRNKFPDIQNFLACNSNEECIEALKAEQCVLYSDDELQLHYRAAWDTSLEVTPERFNTQWIVWPFRLDLDPVVTRLLNRWIYAATINATLDELYFKYFQKALCPVGTAGEHCELPCDPDHGAADATGQCVCESIRWTGDDCAVEVPQDTHSIPVSLKAMAYCMLGFNVIVIGICASWLHYCRFSAQVRYAQPSFLWLVLLGCLISSCTIIPMAQEDGGDADNNAPGSCMAIPWLYSVGFSVTFGTLFAKILRVYLIFTQAAHQKTSDDIATNNRRSFVSFQETLSVIGVVLLIDVAILVAWTVVDPLHWERDIIRADQFGDPMASQGYCTCDHWIEFGGAIAALHLLLLGLACYMCYVARDIPTNFSEGKYLSFAIISNLQIFVVGVPILIILGADPQTSFFVRSVIIWANDLAVVSLVFGNLMFNVHTTPPENNRASFMRREISSAVSQFSQRKQFSSGSLTNPRTMALPPASMEDHFSEPPDLSDTDNQRSRTYALEPEPVTEPKRRQRVSLSSLTLGSCTTATGGSRKSVSWGMAYFSECGGNDMEVGIPIVSPLPVDTVSPPEEANRTRRFSTPSCQGAPRCIRPAASPEASEEFQLNINSPVLPKRHSSIRVDSQKEEVDISCRSHGSALPPCIDEACLNSSGNLHDTGPLLSSDQFVSAIDIFETSNERHTELSPFGRSEALEQAPQKPDRRLTDSSFSSESVVPFWRPSVESAPQKPNRRLTDTSITSGGSDLSASLETPPQRPDRRLTEKSLSSVGPDLKTSEMVAVGKGLGIDCANTAGVQQLGPQKPEWSPTEQSVSPAGGNLRSMSKHLVPLANGTMGRSPEVEKKPSLAVTGNMIGGSRHTAEAAQGAPQLPGRRNSSSFFDLDDFSSDSDEEEDNTYIVKMSEPTKGEDNAESAPELTALWYSSGEITGSELESSGSDPFAPDNTSIQCDEEQETLPSKD